MKEAPSKEELTARLKELEEEEAERMDGMSVRCHITTDDNIVNNREIHDSESPRCWSAAVQGGGMPEAGIVTGE